MFYGWRVVGGAFMAQLFVVGFYTYAVSLLVPPVREEFGVSLEQVMYSMTGATFLGLFLTPVAGILVDRYPVRWLMTAGSLCFAAGLWLLSMSSSITQYVLIFSLAMALSNALASSLSGSAVISRWFTASRGKALGIAAIGTSVGGIIVPGLITLWLGDHGWRGALQNLSLCALLVMVPAVFLTIRGKPADVGMEPEPDHANPGAAEQAALAMTVGDILRTSAFWYLGISLGLLFSTYSSILSNLSPYATGLGHSEASAASLITVVAITGFIGKIVFGMAADRFSLKAGLATAQLLVMIGFLILALEPAYGMLMVACGALGFAAGGMLPVWGAMMARIFGLLSYGRAMGLMGPVLTLCIMPGFAITGRLYDLSGSYTSVLLLFSGLMVLACLLLAPLKVDRS